MPLWLWGLYVTASFFNFMAESIQCKRLAWKLRNYRCCELKQVQAVMQASSSSEKTRCISLKLLFELIWALDGIGAAPGSDNQDSLFGAVRREERYSPLHAPACSDLLLAPTSQAALCAASNLSASIHCLVFPRGTGSFVSCAAGNWTSGLHFTNGWPHPLWPIPQGCK